MTDIHAPLRPSWTCTACDQPWPCDPAREGLALGYQDNLVGLGVYLSGQLGLAVTEIREVTPQELYERFVLWPLALRTPLPVPETP